jgi:hypothetical protein
VKSAGRVDRHGFSKAEGDWSSKPFGGWQKQRHTSGIHSVTLSRHAFPAKVSSARVKAKQKQKSSGFVLRLSHSTLSATNILILRSRDPPNLQSFIQHLPPRLILSEIQNRKGPCAPSRASVRRSTKLPPVISASISTCNPPCAFRISHAAYKSRSFFWAQLSCARRQKLPFPSPIRRPR